MHAVINFNLEDPHEEELWQFHSHAKDFYLAVWDFDQTLRNQIKYCVDGHCLEMLKGIEYARKALHECLNNKDVHLDMLS